MASQFPVGAVLEFRKGDSFYWGRKAAIVHGRCGMVEMLKRYAYIIAALVFLFPTTAAAQVITDGESLRKRCGTFQIIMPSSGLGCRGYIGAVIDILADGNAVYEYRACPPHDEEREALIMAVKARQVPEFSEPKSIGCNRAGSCRDLSLRALMIVSG